MRMTTIAACLLLLPSVLHAQRKVKEVRAAAADGAVRIFVPAGQVTVTGWDRDSIALTGTVPADVRDLVVHVSGPNAKLGYDGNETAEARLEVRVPARSRVWIRTTTADVVIREVRGGVDVNSVSGAIDVRGTPAEAYLESMGGRVEAELDSRVLRVRTAGGDIAVRGRITDAQAYTVSGAIDIVNKYVERGRFESVDGRIQYRGTLGRASTVEFITHSGDMDVALPKNVDADVRISSFQGEVSNLLGGQGQTKAGSLQSRERLLTLGRGGAELILRTFKGAVRLRPL